MAISALYGSWRRSIPNRLFVPSADTQARPARDQNKRRNRKKHKAKAKDVRLAVGESNLQPQRARRPSQKKWSEKKVDSEFDIVIVPSDGISVSGSDSDHSDWSIGWFEPHSRQFTDDEKDTFAVLMPCYGSPTPADAASRKSFRTIKDHKSPVRVDHDGGQSLPAFQHRS